MDAFEQLQSPMTTRWHARLSAELRTYFSPMGGLFGLIAASGFGIFPSVHPELWISIVAMVLWCAHITALMLLQTHTGTVLAPGVVQHVSRLFVRGILINVLLSIALGMSVGWSPTAIAIHACVLCSVGTLVSLAPFVASICAVLVFHVAFIVSVSDYDPTQWPHDHSPFDSIWNPLLFVSISMIVPAWLTWSYRSRLASKGQAWWATSAFTLVDRLMMRSRKNESMWWAKSQFPSWMLASRVSPSRAGAPSHAIRSTLGGMFMLSRVTWGLLLLGVSLLYGFVISLDIDAPWNDPGTSDVRNRHVVMMFAMLVNFVAVDLQRIKIIAKNDSEMAGLYMLPGLGQAARAHKLFLQSTLGTMIGKYVMLSACMLGTGVLVMAYSGCANRIVTDLAICVGVIAILLSAVIVVTLLMLQGRWESRWLQFATIVLPLMAAMSASEHRWSLGVAVVIGNVIAALFLYRRWLRRQHPYLMQ